MKPNRLLTALDDLIREGDALLPIDVRSDETINKFMRGFYKWHAGCLNLMRMLATHGAPWARGMQSLVANESDVRNGLGTLEGIRDAVAKDLLLTVEDLVLAEAFSDLLEQADYLLSSSFVIPACVLARAVLEEHLRKWCDRAGCTPTKARPTMVDYYTELHRISRLNKIDLDHVKSMATTGNEAAHNKGTVAQADAERLLRDVRAFFAQHPVS